MPSNITQVYQNKSIERNIMKLWIWLQNLNIEPEVYN